MFILTSHDFLFCSTSYIFFSNRLNIPKIERARLDGSNRQVLISSRQIVVPEALTLDYANEHVYWADAYLDRVVRFNYDGSNRKVILKKTWVSLIFLVAEYVYVSVSCVYVCVHVCVCVYICVCVCVCVSIQVQACVYTQK